MRKRYLGALVGLIGLGIAGAGGTTVFAAGPGESASDNLTTTTGGFAVGDDGTPALGSTIAQFQIDSGTLSLVAVPNLHFANQNVTALITGNLTLTADGVAISNDDPYDGNNTKTITVADYRGNNAGWTLTAQLGEFTNTKATDEKLTADTAALSGGDVTGDNVTGVTLSTDNFAAESPTTMLDATTGKGAGSTNAKFTGATVTIPQKTAAVAGTYKAAIDWTLAATPDPDSSTNAGDTGA
ncbi:WxL domain-containing protein [Lacticaseibacillus sp. GG6-2]